MRLCWRIAVPKMRQRGFAWLGLGGFRCELLNMADTPVTFTLPKTTAPRLTKHTIMSTQQMAAAEAGVQTGASRPPAPDYPDDEVDEPQVGEDDTHGELDTFDIFSLIVNKMIGTGVYTAPASVYLMTEHKSLALGLWGIGFFYTILRCVNRETAAVAQQEQWYTIER